MNHFDAQEVIAEQEENIEKQARLIKELSIIAEQNELVEEISDRSGHYIVPGSSEIRS